MIIFIPHNSEPDKCPKCRQEEYKIEVCKHCGYIYPQNGFRWYHHVFYVSVIAGIILLVLAVAVFFIACVDTWAQGHLSLVESIAKIAKAWWKVLSNIY